MTFEERIEIHARPEKIFELYADVENWKIWDPEVKASSLNGPFKEGSIGFLIPQKGPKAKIIIEDVIPNRSFTVVSKLPFCTLRFEHDLLCRGIFTEVVHKVIFTGFLSSIFSRLIGRPIKEGLPLTLFGLKTKAEKSHV